MALPPIGQLTAVSAQTWRAFGERLQAIGFTGDAARRLKRSGAGPFPRLRQPLQRWHARRLQEPAAYALRLFTFGDTLSEREAQQAFGPELTARLRDGGLIVERDGSLSSPFEMDEFNGLSILADSLIQGGDAVMGPGKTTDFCTAAARPQHPLSRVLEVGCGAGPMALFFAGHAEEVIATDINPRALALTRVNALINGVENVQLREGDLFAPVSGETFDLVVAQPPYVPQPPEQQDAVFLFGGSRGDELALRCLAQAPAYLQPEGRAVLLTDWPKIGDEAVAQRAVQALEGSGRGLLLLHGPPQTADSLAMVYAAGLAASWDSGLEPAMWRWRDHLAAQGITAIHPTINVIGPGPNGRTWSSDYFVERMDRLNPAAIDRIYRAHGLLTGPDEDLWEARLRAPDQVRVSSGMGGSGQQVCRLESPPETLAPAMECSFEAFRLLQAVTKADTVRDALTSGGPAAETSKEDALKVVKYWLKAGMLS